MLVEEWRAVPCYSEGSWEVSSLGRLRSCDKIICAKNRWGNVATLRYKGRILTPHFLPNGYEGRLFRRGEKHELVHRLVALAFLPNPNGLAEVNHINGVKSDNRAENLEWVSSSENKRHSYSRQGRAVHARATPVLLIQGTNRKIFENEHRVAEFLGCNQGSVHSARTRKHRCCGYLVEAYDGAR